MKIDPLQIIYIVFGYFNIPIEEIVSISKRAEIVRVRQISMYFIKEYTRLSLNQIGYYFIGRNGYKDHATVLHAVKVVNNEIETCKIYQYDIDEIRKIILSKINGDHIIPNEVFLRKQIDILNVEIKRLNKAYTNMRARCYRLEKQVNRVPLPLNPALPMPYSIMEFSVNN